ncbi:MAG: amidoligase family protein [Rhizomicrobium sp.]
MTVLSWKMGFEIELMAPKGVSRADLAARVAQRQGGTVRRFFHPQSEPALVPGQPVFENLTLGFEALDAGGRRIAAFVDDLTLQGGLDKTARPKAGWYRVVADDARLLRLVMRHCDPGAPLAELLNPLAALFGTVPQVQATGMVRIVDDRGISVAIGAPLPGERERPCEIVTAPLAADHERVLGGLLAEARAAGFGTPLEGATHIHFDATPLLSAPVVANLVEVFSRFGDELKTLVGANPAACAWGVGRRRWRSWCAARRSGRWTGRRHARP